MFSSYEASKHFVIFGQLSAGFGAELGPQVRKCILDTLITQKTHL